MSPVQFFSKPENAYLLTLLVAAPITNEERHQWLQMMPFMEEGEKEQLARNLQGDIEDMAALENIKTEALQKKIDEA